MVFRERIFAGKTWKKKHTHTLKITVFFYKLTENYGIFFKINSQYNLLKIIFHGINYKKFLILCFH
jgi:hypothetical protein